MMQTMAIKEVMATMTAIMCSPEEKQHQVSLCRNDVTRDSQKTGSWESLTVLLLLLNSIINFYYLFRDRPLKDPLRAVRQCCVTWSFLEHETRVKVKLKL